MLFFVGAILCICAAHFIRVLRWELFIDIYEKPDRRRLVQSLSVGYLLNYFIPFKLGDIGRACFAGRKMKNGTPLGLSTVIVDRFLDIVCVGGIFLFLSFGGKDAKNTQAIALTYFVLAIVVLVIMLAFYLLRKFVKKAIRAFASVFNEKIEAALLQFAWALIWNFKDIFQKISKLRLIVTTIGMWLMYLLSYFLFAKFSGMFGKTATWADVFMLLFAQNGIKESTGVVTLFKNGVISTHPIFIVVYIALPLVLMLLLSLLIKEREVDNESADNYLNLLPHLDPQERLNFLERYFDDSSREYVRSYLKINQGISIIRDYSAGSNATTMLCMDNTETFFRKYAFGEDGEKLYQQIRWIQDNSNRLVLPDIIRSSKTEQYCFYDMPYESNAVGLFEYAHSMPIEQSWEMIQSALESLEDSIYKINARKADPETINNYVETKVLKNVSIIKNAKRIKPLQQYETLIINGVEYKNLEYYSKYLSEEYLYDVFKNDTYAVIHGDLTIENIICTRDQFGKDDFYIIDPNTGNVHDSPNLDYGKLLQSIHGGYEFLMSTKEVKVSGNRIDFLFTRSLAYTELHSRLLEYMKENLGEERTRSIYYHEVIHWLRLMPYKINKDGKRAIIFYAGMLMVMSDVFKLYGETDE